MSLNESSVAMPAYADDLVLINKSRGGLRTLFGRLKETAKKVGLKINDSKTKYMIMGRRDRQDGNVSFRKIGKL